MVVSITSSSNRGRSKVDDELDTLLKKRVKKVRRIAKADAKLAKATAKATEKRQEEVGNAPQKLVQLDEQLAAFLKAHRYTLTNRHSKTIKREHGEVSVKLNAIELELPGDESGVVNILQSIRGGKRYLVPTWKLNKRAFLQAPPGLFSKVQKRVKGVWRGKHWGFSVKSPGELHSKTISKPRYNDHSS